MGRTVMNQSALSFHDLGECFTHSKRIRTTHRNFSMGFGSQSLRQKLAQGGKFGRASETWISKNSLESHFSFIRNISLVVRPWIKMRYISLFQKNVLYNQNVCVRRIENFLRASEVKVFTKNSHKVAGSAELQRLEFQKIHLKVTFPSIKNVSWVVWSWIKVRYISLI